jgi:hypothetical protein
MKNIQLLSSDELSVILPEKRDFLNPKDEPKNNPVKDLENNSHFLLWIRSDADIKNKMIHVVINVVICKDPKKSAYYTRGFLAASAPDSMKEGSIYNPRKSIGQGSWYGDAGDVLCGYDGAFIYTIALFPSSYINLTGKRVLYPILPEDCHLIENLATNMLHRATALGLTSIQKEKAPAWAKRQVEDRLARLKKS